MVKNLSPNAGDVRDLDSILDQEDCLEEGMATHSSTLIWRVPWTEGPGDYSPCGHKELDMTEVTYHAHVKCKEGESLLK